MAQAPLHEASTLRKSASTHRGAPAGWCSSAPIGSDAAGPPEDPAYKGTHT